MEPITTDSASDPPKSDSTNLSVQTIIMRYDEKMAAAAAQKPTTPPDVNNLQKPQPYTRTRVLPDTLDGAHNQHLYNTPNFPKKDVEVFSNEPIVVHLPKTAGDNINHNNASASSSITLLTGGAEEAAKTPGGTGAGKGRAGVFSACIWLAVVQLLLSVTLTALGVLMLLREASSARSGSGLWAGGVAAIAGALGVISNIRKARTGFLAVSLICVASSTLAMALTGTGLVRDVNSVSG